MKATPQNCTKSNGCFHPFLPSVYRRKTCVTGIRENTCPGSTPPTTNRKPITQSDAHIFSQPKSPASVTLSKSSIGSWKLTNNNAMHPSETSRIIAVSRINILKIVLPSAPLHLCTPMDLARRLMDEIDIRI